MRVVACCRGTLLASECNWGRLGATIGCQVEPQVNEQGGLGHQGTLCDDESMTLVENRPLIQGPNQALVPENIAPGTRETFSPGWWLQPGLKVPAQWLLRQAVVARDL